MQRHPLEKQLIMAGGIVAVLAAYVFFLAMGDAS